MMKDRTFFHSLIVVILVVLALVALHRPVRAQSGDVCYAVADQTTGGSNADALVTLNWVTGETVLIGFPGTNTVEAIALELGGGVIYAANGNRLGTLDKVTAAFTPMPQTFGTASGAAGEVALSDVDGLTVDPGTGILYGTHRRSGAPKDLLFQVNKSTGAHVPDAFGPGVDYVVVDGPGLLYDIDDISVSPVTAVMYGSSNSDGAGGLLVQINKNTGAATVVGEFGVDDIEGISYFNDGQLYGSTGKFSTGPDTENKLYVIDETTGAATFIAAFSQFNDYEALGCLTGPTSVTLAGVAARGAGLALESIALAGVALVALLTLFVTRRRTTA
jgi:hypothetical protein